MADGYSVKPLTPLRKVIASRMVHAKQTIPHFRVCAEVEVDRLLRLRATLKQRNAGADLSVNDLLVKACAAALVDVPAVNVQYVDTEVRQYHAADISVVTAIEGGLTTPVIRAADTKSIWQISSEIRALTTRAAKNALTMDEISGGTFSISNLGMYDVDQFDAIINVPQCAILAVGCAKPRVLATADQQVRVASTLQLTLSLDHRVLDGVAAATFLTALRARIEQPDHLAENDAGRQE
jgi:pyruvate dehydrogenase E2 component (dihydrolipoamide acetyltransferase)